MAVNEYIFPARELNLNGVLNASCTQSYGVQTWAKCEVASHLKPNSGTWNTAVVKMQKSDDEGATWTTDESFSLTGEQIQTEIDIADTWWVRFLVTTLEGAAGVAQLTLRVIGFHDIDDFDTTTTRVGRIAHSPKIFELTDPTAGDEFTLMYTGAAITVGEVGGTTNAGTCTINFEIRNKATPDVAGTDILTADLVTDDTGETTSTFNSSGAVAANKFVVGTISAVSGATPERLQGFFDYTVD